MTAGLEYLTELGQCLQHNVKIVQHTERWLFRRSRRSPPASLAISPPAWCSCSSVTSRLL